MPNPLADTPIPSRVPPNPLEDTPAPSRATPNPLAATPSPSREKQFPGRGRSIPRQQTGFASRPQGHPTDGTRNHPRAKGPRFSSCPAMKRSHKIAHAIEEFYLGRKKHINRNAPACHERTPRFMRTGFPFRLHVPIFAEFRVRSKSRSSIADTHDNDPQCIVVRRMRADPRRREPQAV